MDDILNLIKGNLTTEERIWTALAPGIFFTAYFILGLVVYSVRNFIAGTFRDTEFEKRERTILTGLWIRLYFAWAMKPLWWAVLKSGIPAKTITTLSFLFSVASGVSIAMGRFSLGGWLFIISGICDFLDGRIARARNEVSQSGALLDSSLDRYSDGAVFIGLAWFYRESWVLFAVLIGFLGTQMVSYVRARGEALGIQIKIGLMQRAERILLLGVSVALSPIVEAVLAPNEQRPDHRVAIAAIVLLAIMTQVTAARRLFYGLRALGSKPLKDWISSSRGSLLRNIASAIIATGVDFVVFYFLVTVVIWSPGFSTTMGCLVGAFVNFTMNRVWTFGSSAPPLRQIRRYAFVSATSALLNSGGVMVLLLVPSVEYRVAWILVRAAVFVSWNFPLQGDYVFKTDIPV